MVQPAGRRLASSIRPEVFVRHDPKWDKFQPLRPHQRSVDGQMVRWLGIVSEPTKSCPFCEGLGCLINSPQVFYEPRMIILGYLGYIKFFIIPRPIKYLIFKYLKPFHQERTL